MYTRLFGVYSLGHTCDCRFSVPNLRLASVGKASGRGANRRLGSGVNSMSINCDSKFEVSIAIGIIIATVLGTVKKCHGSMLPTLSQYQDFHVLIRLHLSRSTTV